MTPPFLLELMHARAYPHPCAAIELVETHISWVLLTGELAYKIKKPIDYGFADFSTLELRRRYCAEEVRLNGRFAPTLYLDVVAITRDDGRITVSGAGEAIEYAVRMRQFPAEMQLDRRLEAGRLEANDLSTFASTLARVHDGLPRCDPDSPFATPEAVFRSVRENFRQIAGTAFAHVRADLVAPLARVSDTREAELAKLIAKRRVDGFARECHGDLHLQNLVQLDDGIHAFDCIEFNDDLRWIDVISDVAFLAMDLSVRGRRDLAYGFLNRYLEATGDYAGAALLSLYLVYRSMVRAMVIALQAKSADDEPLKKRFEGHVVFAHERAFRARPAVILTCGLSGSGKSWLAQRLVHELPALCIRSDVERKRLAGMAASARTDSAVGAGLYTRQHDEHLYTHLAARARDVIAGGEHVIVDATFLTAVRRTALRDEATRLGVPCVIVHCVAPIKVLEARIEQRAEAGRDASEATLEVLRSQRERYEPPLASEGTIVTVDTGGTVDVVAIGNRIRAAARFRPPTS